MMNKHRVYLSLGSNMGDREENLFSAIRQLAEDSKIKHLASSSIYETEPVGNVEQAFFLNMAILIETTYTPYELLTVTSYIEDLLLRKRSIRWGPRTIDIDILLFDEIELLDEKLTIPHKELFHRAFVLYPLREVYSEDKIIDFTSYIVRCEEQQGLTIFRRCSKTFLDPSVHVNTTGKK
ncbi:2-amino-4-hydroxy-6-hydroxymethyldihydropteridine pyrophosphokinase [compost metagenome]